MSAILAIVAPGVRPSVVVLGLDGLAPDLVFGKYRDRLPTFARLMRCGTWGRLRSVDPPVTVPAWACLTTGCSPSRLGLYGFRHRELGSTSRVLTATSHDVTLPRVWQLLGDRGMSCGMLGVPQTWPPAPVDGFLVTDFLTPPGPVPFTFPIGLAQQIMASHGPYRFDVQAYRTSDLDSVAKEVRAVTALHFDVFASLATQRFYDFLMLVEMGPDRMHHAAFRTCDEGHPRHAPGPDRVFEYYAYLDDRLARLLEVLGPDRHVFIVSDHGAKSMHGGFRLNQWLVERGHLILRQRFRRARPFDEDLVDFTRTRAWAWGGHYGRIFINLEGREPSGVVARRDYDAFRDTLAAELEATRAPDGTALGTRVLPPSCPQGLPGPAGHYPDLMVYAGDLRYRAIGTVGGEGLFTPTNDTGPDDANHDYDGVLVHTGPAPILGGGELRGAHLLDIAPTILRVFGLNPPPWMDGRSLMG